MKKLVNKKDAINILDILISSYPEAKASLNFNTPFQLLIAVSLSAQCTDERVNIITKELFKKYSTPKDFANAQLNDIEKMIHSCGFYRNKAKNVIGAGKVIIQNFGGEVPHSIDELTTIPGVGRKSANVIMCDAFGYSEGIAVDTHVKRISNRIGLSLEIDPLKIEQDLLKIYPKKYYNIINHVFIYHGRNCCISRKPNCENCPIKDLCLKNI